MAENEGPRSEKEAEDVEQVIRRIQAGSSRDEGFQEIHELYCRPVSNYFANRGFTEAEAEELGQEVFLRVYRNIGSFRFDASFKTWLFKIVVNVWRNAVRDREAKKRRVESVPLEKITHAEDERPGPDRALEDPSDDPLDQALASERTRLLNESLQELPPKMRDSMLLRLGQELKYREIADLTGVSIATVKTHLSEGYKRLKPVLARHFNVDRV